MFTGTVTVDGKTLPRFEYVAPLDNQDFLGD
jgi:hypothetical protein